MAPVFNVAVLIYPDSDIIDFSGPLEVYTTFPPPDTPASFKSTTFGWHSPVKVGAGALKVIPDASIDEISSNLENYDILVVPGAMPDTITDMLKEEDGKAIKALIEKFAGLKPRKETGHRIVQSVCSGALLLAASGILANKTVTTHHMCLDLLKDIADEAAGGKGKSNTNVVSKRWVDAGLTDAGVRIVNAGGVTSGIDTSLWVVELLVDKERAAFIADIVEFERRKQDDGWVSSP